MEKGRKNEWEIVINVTFVLLKANWPKGALEEKSKFIVCDGWITEVIGLNTFTEVSAIDSVISTEVSN